MNAIDSNCKEKLFGNVLLLLRDDRSVTELVNSIKNNQYNSHKNELILKYFKNIIIDNTITFPLIIHYFINKEIDRINDIHAASDKGNVDNTNKNILTVSNSDCISNNITAINNNNTIINDNIKATNNTIQNSEAPLSRNELDSISIGGYKVNVKVKQKKRMKPNRVSEKTTNNTLIGNISSIKDSNSNSDLRKELVDSKFNISSRLSVVSYRKQTAAFRSLNSINSNNYSIYDNGSKSMTDGIAGSERRDQSDDSSNNDTISKDTTNPTTATTTATNNSSVEDYTAIIIRLARLYSLLILSQDISINLCFLTITKLTTIDITQLQSNNNGNTNGNNKDMLFIKVKYLKLFITTLITNIKVLVLHFNSAILQQILTSITMKLLLPELITMLVTDYEKATGYTIEKNDSHYSYSNSSIAAHNSTVFRLPENFLKPFREEYDNKNEYKTQIELRVYHERERCYDEFSNLLYRFQQVSRSNIDGSQIIAYFNNDLITTGNNILRMRDSNYSWFAEMFVTQLLYYGLRPTQNITTGSVVNSNIAIDVDKYSKLEQRLGYGGEVKKTQHANWFNNNYSSSNSGGNSSTDYYREPSMHFEGTLQFFFRFIILLNNNKFNSKIHTTMIKEISSIIPSKVLQHTNNNNYDYTINKNGGSDESNFALKIAKLRILGKFLGFLQFYSNWNLSDDLPWDSPLRSADNTNNNSIIKNYCSNGNNSFIKELLFNSYTIGMLSYIIPFTTEYLSMIIWDDSIKMILRKYYESNKLIESFPCSDILSLLKSIQFSEVFSLKYNKKYSSNRLYTLYELQRLWTIFPMQSIPTIDLPSTKYSNSDNNNNNIEAVEDTLLRTALHSDNNSNTYYSDIIDNQNFAFTVLFLHQITPAICDVYQHWKKQLLEVNNKVKCSTYNNSSSYNSNSGRNGKKSMLLPNSIVESDDIIATSSNKKKVKKRQTPSIVTPENTAFLNAFSNVSDGGMNNIRNSNTASSTVGAESSSALLSPIRSAAQPDSDFTMTINTPTSNNNNNSNRSNTSPRLRNNSYSDGNQKNGGSSGNNSIDNKFTPVNAARLRRDTSDSSINNNYHYSRSSRPSPLLFSNNNNGSPFKMNDDDNDSILRRLETSFWHQHQSLQQLYDFLLSNNDQTCLSHIRDLVAASARELVTVLTGIYNTAIQKYNNSNSGYNNSNNSNSSGGVIDTIIQQSKNAMSQQYSTLVANGVSMLTDYYNNFTTNIITNIITLYPLQKRVIKMAMFFINKHINLQKNQFIAHIKAYGKRKLCELCELSLKQYKKKIVELTIIADKPNISTQPELIYLVTQDNYMVDQIITKYYNIINNNIKNYYTALSSEICPEVEQYVDFQFMFPPVPIMKHDTDSIRNRNTINYLFAITIDIMEIFCRFGIDLFQWDDNNQSMILPNKVIESTDKYSMMLKSFLHFFESLLLSIANYISNIRDSDVTTSELVINNTAACATTTATSNINSMVLLSDEYIGKLKVDFAKFVTSITPLVLYLDLIQSVVIYNTSSDTSNGNSATNDISVTGVLHYSSSMFLKQNSCAFQSTNFSNNINSTTPNNYDNSKSSTVFYPSDVLLLMLDSDLVTVDALTNTIAMVVNRNKSLAYYQHCKQLRGLQKCAVTTTLLLIKRLLIRNNTIWKNDDKCTIINTIINATTCINNSNSSSDGGSGDWVDNIQLLQLIKDNYSLSLYETINTLKRLKP